MVVRKYWWMPVLFGAAGLLAGLVSNVFLTGEVMPGLILGVAFVAASVSLLAAMALAFADATKGASMIGTILQLLPLALTAWVLGRASGLRQQQRPRPCSTP
ncbi:MAG: hypothetical protein R3E96_17240 [Planctomycetota bacterium]